MRHLWERVQASLWFVPTGMSLGAAALALAVGSVDESLNAGASSLPLFYAGDREGARTLLSTVAGSMITVAGVTFSVTVVALSLASSQFGPRLLLNFMRDRGNQLVLGTFIATFLFCLISLGQGGRDPEAVPRAAATVALLLAVASLLVLIYFIHHVSSSIRAEHVVERVARDLDSGIERLFPTASAEEEPGATEMEFEGDEPPVAASRDGYLQRVDEQALVSIAVDEDLVLRLLRRPGHFVVEGEPLVLVAGRDDLPSELEERIRAALFLGRERTQEQDPEHGVHQLVEVAVRALSPGVNDPYTALSCVDWLGAALCKLGGRPLRPPIRRGPVAELRLIVAPIDFEGLLAAAFNQIRQFAHTTPAVSIRMLEMLERIAQRVVFDRDRSAAVHHHAEMILEAALSEGMQKRDRQDLEARYDAVLHALKAAG